MKKIAGVIVIIAFSILKSYAQPVEKCSTLVVTRTNAQLQSLNAEDVKNFLLTLAQICITDTQYTVLSNELLFKMLDEHTDLLLGVIYANESAFDLEAILYQVSHPSNPDFNISELIKKVQQTKAYGTINERVITELRSVR